MFRTSFVVYLTDLFMMGWGFLFIIEDFFNRSDLPMLWWCMRYFFMRRVKKWWISWISLVVGRIRGISAIGVIMIRFM
jgi:hypothetical protein